MLAEGGTEGGEAGPSPGDRTHKSGDTKSSKANFLDPTHPAFRERLSQRHFLGDSKDNAQRKNCVLCYKTCPTKNGEKRVQTHCKQCGLFMHLECFEQWHTVADPVSPLFADVFNLQKGLLRE